VRAKAGAAVMRSPWQLGCGRCGFEGPSGLVEFGDYRAFGGGMPVNVFNPSACR